MKDRRRTTAFYMEMILLVAVLTGVVLMLADVFTTAKEQSSQAKTLTTAVRLAENAAEIVAGIQDRSEMVDMLGGGDSAACHLEMQKILARFNSSLAPDPDGGYCVEITWIDYDGLISYNISVTWQEDSEQVYNLKTAVFYG